MKNEKLIKSNEKSASNLSTEPDETTKMGDNADGLQYMGVLPNNFFDNKETTENQTSQQPNLEENNGSELKQVNRILDSNQISQASKKMDGSEAKQVKGALPEGFFDNKDADLRARGIEPVKVDIK